MNDDNDWLLSVAEAKQMWAELRDGFINQERKIAEIIVNRAWEPVGHETFVSAWNEEMLTVNLAAEVRPHVVYQMISEGLSDEEICTLVKGVGTSRVSSFRQEMENGVPAGVSIVRRHPRNKPIPPSYLRLQVGAANLKAWRRKFGPDVEDFALEAVIQRFEELG